MVSPDCIWLPPHVRESASLAESGIWVAASVRARWSRGRTTNDELLCATNAHTRSQPPSAKNMGGSCTKSSRVGVDNQLDVSAALLHAKRAVALSSEASAGGSQNSALERELDLLVQILQPSKRHPNALSQRSVTFSSMLTEDIAEHSDEDAPDEHFPVVRAPPLIS
jgi:hypothetical protein